MKKGKICIVDLEFMRPFPAAYELAYHFATYESIAVVSWRCIISYRQILEKQEYLRKYSILIADTQLWHVTPWVSRAPPYPPLPDFLGPNGT